jgi:hypothetical protein
MPGFAAVMSPADRWDVINFVRARAAGVLSRGVGPEISTAAAPAIPDFAFEASGRQHTLDQVLQTGPAVVALFGAPPSVGRMTQLAAAQQRLAAAGAQILPVDLSSASSAAPETAAPPPLIGIASDVAATLALFRAADDGGETDLMLDRAGNVRARWTADGAGGVPGAAALVADAARVARFPAAAENHAGHGE